MFRPAYRGKIVAPQFKSYKTAAQSRPITPPAATPSPVTTPSPVIQPPPAFVPPPIVQPPVTQQPSPPAGGSPPNLAGPIFDIFTPPQGGGPETEVPGIADDVRSANGVGGGVVAGQPRQRLINAMLKVQ